MRSGGRAQCRKSKGAYDLMNSLTRNAYYGYDTQEDDLEAFL